MLMASPSLFTDLSGIEKLAAHHLVKGFKSTEHSLNDWLKRYALQNQIVDSAQTYVVHRDRVVVAYYTMVYGDIALEECPSGVRDGMPPKYSVPFMKIARLAVDRRDARRGLGSALMKDAFARILRASEIGGLRAVVVDAMHEEAKRYYQEKFRFEESPVNPFLLFLRIADVRLASDTRSLESPE
jgi:GNAT superfamily N-acetyltransferase